MAEEWTVKRVIFSSTAGIYLGLAESPIKEDRPIFLDSPFPIIAYQKIVEIATAEFAKKSGISCACVRLMGMFGPGQDPAAGISLAPALVHAAVSGRPRVIEDLFGACADDGDDMCYIKDMGRAIALLQTAEKLNHDVYNVSSGKVISNRELVEAVQEAVPGFQVELPSGRSPMSLPALDIERFRADTRFSPDFDIRSAVLDYVQWLKAGNAK